MVPNFVDRSIWGISHTANFAYIDGGAPAITHTHTRGTMDIKGTLSSRTNLAVGYYGAIWSGSGAFTPSRSTGSLTSPLKVDNYDALKSDVFTFTASKNWTGSTSNNSSVNSVYGKYTNGIRPNSLSIKVKTRYY